MKRAKLLVALCVAVSLVAAVAVKAVSPVGASATVTCTTGDFCLAPKISAPITNIRSVTPPKIAVPSWLEEGAADE